MCLGVRDIREIRAPVEGGGNRTRLRFRSNLRALLRLHHMSRPRRCTGAALRETIERLEKRIAAYRADSETLGRSSDMIIGGKPAGEQTLGMALSRLPHSPGQHQIGTYRGLKFGIERLAGGWADVYLAGQATRKDSLSKDAQGPRAVMNALNRLTVGLEALIETAKEVR